MSWCNSVDKKITISRKLDKIDDGFCLLFFLKSLEDYDLRYVKNAVEAINAKL